MMRRWWYPQKTITICAENIGSVFWVQNTLGLCSWCLATKKWSLINMFSLYIKTFWRLSNNSGDSSRFTEKPSIFSEEPSDFLERSSDWFEDPHPQNFLRISDVILRIFRGSSEFSEDPHPQNFLRILRIFWGSSSSDFSEERHLQNFLTILILRIFWGSSSSEFS